MLMSLIIALTSFSKLHQLLNVGLGLWTCNHTVRSSEGKIMSVMSSLEVPDVVKVFIGIISASSGYYTFFSPHLFKKINLILIDDN